MVAYIPACSDTAAGFESLFGFYERMQATSQPVVLDFERAGALGHHTIAFLGGAVRTLRSEGRAVDFNWGTLSRTNRDTLGRNGFLAAFSATSKHEQGHTVPYREDKNREGVIEYLLDDWLGRGWVHLSKLLQGEIAGKTYELYTNAFDHAESPSGVFSCGQHYEATQELKLCVVDFGNGIPLTVRGYFERLRGPIWNSTKDSAFLDWSFRSGATTKPTTSRGLGLDLLREFVKLNKGFLEIFSNNGRARIEEANEVFSDIQQFFPGTVVNITFVCDEKYYRFASESESGPLF